MDQFKALEIKTALKRLVKQKSLTYEDLAEELECSIPTVKRILGQEELTLSRLLQLCEILEITLTELELLIGGEKKKVERFTPEQDVFLAKNPAHFAYFMRLLSGKSPKQIGEEFKLTQRSTDKYLIALERLELIRVTGTQKIKPIFKGTPELGRGPLARAHYRSMIEYASQFFVDQIAEEMQKKPTGVNPPDDILKGFSILTSKVSRATYQEWVARQEKAVRDLESLASFEEKSKPDSELMTMVYMQAHTLLSHNARGLDRLENAFGEIVNL